MKILIASCVRQSPSILKKFLHSLEHLEKGDNEIDYFFVSNNNTEESSNLLRESNLKNLKVIEVEEKIEYKKDNITHYWNPELIKFMIKLKRIVFDYSITGKYDYLFLTDSDNILHPKTLLHLLSQDKDILSEIQWTRWKPEMPEMPNCWFFGEYGFYPGDLEKLRKPQLYQVVGFGGLLLISKKALETGVSYDFANEIGPNIGEDRHFAFNAKMKCFDLWIDTNYPMEHLYREEINYDFLRGKKITIAVPHTGEIRAELVQVLLNIVAISERFDFHLRIDLRHGFPLDSNRNAICKHFLETDSEWLLMIDSDIVPPFNILELIRHDKKVVGAACFTVTDKQEPFPVIMFKNPDKDGYRVIKSSELMPLVKCDATGTGCLLIHCSIIETINKDWFRMGYDSDGIVNIISEDFDFCRKVLNIEESIYVDTTLQCKHLRVCDIKRINELMGEIKNG